MLWVAWAEEHQLEKNACPVVADIRRVLVIGTALGGVDLHEMNDARDGAVLREGTGPKQNLSPVHLSIGLESNYSV
ncbi:MAG: hypothetical protein OXT06_25140 [Rhodospirillaceae bacterium]|nr:hypothetical protein [Rhodospirillaceae bacterium]MDD9917055.1 hypothetical protein [Rhodospirillaceae bacterium]MDD9927722.1 hypothetical protein [Rhodospirillaceae bacterium]